MPFSYRFVYDFYSSSFLSCLLGPAALLMCTRGAIYLIDLQGSKIEESSHIIELSGQIIDLDLSQAL